MKIIGRYVLKEHAGPFVFALSALTSLMLLQYIAKQFGNLVGRGLEWTTIAEFFLLAIPFTVEMTLPMSVLIAVLYAFSRLASENEITALKAGGVSTRALLRPVLAAATVLSLFLVYFNDQIESRANHQLATLQIAILRTKPTFALKPQIINIVKEGQLYLRADQITQDESGRMRGVTIFDVSDGSRRRSIYADSGTLAFAANRRDLIMTLYHGMMISIPTNQAEQLTRIYYQRDRLKVRDVASSGFQSMSADTTSKGDREMTVCEMQEAYEQRHKALQRAYYDSLLAAGRIREGKPANEQPAEMPPFKPTNAGGLGALYCRFITKYLKIPVAQAAELPPRRAVARAQQDTTKPVQDTAKKLPRHKPGDSVMALVGTILKKVPWDKIPPGAYLPETAGRAAGPVPAPSANPGTLPLGARTSIPPAAAPPQPAPQPAVVPAPAPSTGSAAIELNDARIRLEEARHGRNRYGIEIQKKFSLAFACIVFVLVGGPIALRFPRGGVGLVMGVGFSVFAIYYVGLMGGEELANHNYVSPLLAMWIDNLIFLLVGVVLLTRMGHERVTSRGGNVREAMDSVRAWFARRGRPESGAPT
jgi:lipopolysaccharide export system permease protein